MKMTDVVFVCESLGIAPQPGPHGVRVGTTGWRIENGSGIAGNGGDWWLRVISGMYHPKAPDATAEPIGPARTRAQLRAIIMRKWPTQTKNYLLAKPSKARTTKSITLVCVTCKAKAAFRATRKYTAAEMFAINGWWQLGDGQRGRCQACETERP